MEIATFSPTAAGQFYLLSYWLTANIWAFPSGFSIPFKNRPEDFHSLWAFPSSYPTAFKSISKRLSAKT
jgi:hypothetical protein